MNISCTSKKDLITQHVIEGQCYQKFREIELFNGQSLWENIISAGSSGASYLVTGLGYSADIIVTFTGELVGTVIVCSPFIVADGLVGGDGSIAQACTRNIEPKRYKRLNPGLGKKTYASTANWRCPNIDSVAEALINAAVCYQERGEKEIAIKQIEEIINSNVMERCLSSELKKKISLLGISLK